MTSKDTAQPTKKMPYVRLGNSGLKVSRIILGAMSYGSSQWLNWVIEDEDEVARHIKAAYDLGINTFDTSNNYSNGLSEILLGKTIKRLGLPRDEIVVMTKHIFDSVKHSLERLQLDYIDVLQCHRFDYETPIEETMQALHDVVKAGYVRYIGISSCWAYQYYAMANKLTPFISVQNHYTLLYREEEREMYPTLKMFGVGTIPWSPLAMGLLARPLSEQTTKRSTPDWYRFIGQFSEQGGAEIINRVEEVAKKRGISMAQVSIAWLLSKEGVTAPIVGTTSLKHLYDIADAVHVQLTREEIKYLEEPYKPQAVWGHA
ncbi:Aldo/keto reductase [Gloeophyllum trabeum ATCC 11539]|uniref:Aldo/keto reductase n=1 Tax=Gloeophyllum trabeum (strain ATCC 11539 / FP-39264 / Madison 617) TaxID=670483 RepID=S7PU56_GLOTA|nr:Aldo/keto reductase [Gloeophyllum trabeum ATCC 11539]EPQ50862.1 Aldo/keto reductase [Gloeophyllum trabeum ATCC 11539]